MTTAIAGAAATSADDTPFNPHKRDYKKAIIIVAFCFIPVALLVIFTYWPFIQMCGYSFYKMKYIGTPRFIGLRNYRDIFTRPELLATLKLSLYYMAGALIQVGLALYLSTLLAFRVRGGAFFKGAMFFPYLINGIAVGFIFKFFYTRGYVLDTVLQWCGFQLDNLPYWLKDQSINNWSLVGSSIWRYLGQNVILFIGAIMSIDSSLYEAAEIDGANKWQQFKHIILPGIKTILVLNIILSITGSLSAFEVRTSSPPARTAPAPTWCRWTRSRTPTRRWAWRPPWPWCCWSSSSAHCCRRSSWACCSRTPMTAPRRPASRLRRSKSSAGAR